MGRGEKTFLLIVAVDRSTNDSEWSQTELRFTSDYDGAFNFTLGFFMDETQSATNYGIATPYMEYWGNVSSGPNTIFSPASAGLVEHLTGLITLAHCQWLALKLQQV